MRSSEDLLARVAEAAKHPMALLFGALAAECRTPSETARVAQESGLSNEEEKLAKWVAVLKRDSQTLFGKGYLDVLGEVGKEEEMAGKKEFDYRSAFWRLFEFSFDTLISDQDFVRSLPEEELQEKLEEILPRFEKHIEQMKAPRGNWGTVFYKMECQQALSAWRRILRELKSESCSSRASKKTDSNNYRGGSKKKY